MKKIILLMLVLCLTQSGQAAVIQIGLTGQVDNVYDIYNLLEGKIQQGDIITGYYIYDSETPDSDPSIYTGTYWNTAQPYGLYISIGSLSFQTDPSNTEFLIGVSNNYYGEISDSFIANSYNNLSLSESIFVDNLYWGMDDYDGIALSDDSIPLSVFDLSQWEFIYLTIAGHEYPLPSGVDKMTFDINGTISSIFLIPEPATFLLLSIGILVINKKRFQK